MADALLNLYRAYKNFFRDQTVGFQGFKHKKKPMQSDTMNNQNGTSILSVGEILRIRRCSLENKFLN
ncbi:hypothetical protein ACH95_10765 [Bacillus glycinifermentans]|nr:hypothetical protein ACH95_10765 [Bacillus glycinifermentans]